ncbi:hypothetical protein FA13DRAFT_1010513 [Coprinellus micaceus]|uniref:Uncharacterized protein n=1 Tax=Coprinellus micaceus TaxID=71717 RepID=A0A4Y7SYN4_COPMI|nr:hypothetical protein FA13DRAFT_1010513 [Coprinellus micaceus]
MPYFEDTQRKPFSRATMQFLHNSPSIPAKRANRCIRHTPLLVSQNMRSGKAEISQITRQPAPQGGVAPLSSDRSPPYPWASSF